MVKTNPRDRSRTEAGKTLSLVMKHNRPPEDQGGWFAMTRDLLLSAAYRTLSGNARKAFDRLLIEHIDQGRLSNGRLIVTHDQFAEYGVTAEYIADALDELDFKGIARMHRGRAGNGTAHPTIFRLTFAGGYDGAAPTNDWKRTTFDDAKRWAETVRHERRDRRAGVGRKKKSSLRDSEIRPLRDSEIRRVS